MTTKLRWLLQSTASHPGLAEGRAPDDLLNPVEQTELAKLRIPKRRRDWLLGRWTAKHLVQSYLAETTGTPPALADIHIANDITGAPYATLNPHTRILANPLPLSISHAGHRALCALSPEPDAQVGADIELVERRQPDFAETFFTEAERQFVRQVVAQERDVYITALWSAKEAAFKALRTNQRIEPRQISCTLPALLLPDQWTPIDISLAPDLLPIAQPKAHIQAWGWIEKGYVMTIAVLTASLAADANINLQS